MIPSGPVATFTITDQGTEDAVKPSDKVIQNTKPGHQKIKSSKRMSKAQHHYQELHFNLSQVRVLS
ncbi:hypothetical protein [Streptococcus equi]|uniref:hypothetical protein n=1 Tax=Streptococcus equi TaxID=1336 RepID=UPI0039C6428B